MEPAAIDPVEADGSIRVMTCAIRHRGPDAEGAWMDARAGVALGHRRLAIVDLTVEGSQPMHSPSGRYVIVFNGEIYNFQELRAELPGIPWRGHSDTEVLLAGFDRWGIHAMLQRCSGMFAFAVWDRRERHLTLGRDRFGEKPLYYGCQGRRLLFASELKAFQKLPGFTAEIDRSALATFIQHGYIPAPYSIYQGIRKLLPGTILQIVPERLPEFENPLSYWSLENAVSASALDPFRGSREEAIAELEIMLRRATRQQMMADVPLGAFLSGGVDSSTIVALMQAQSGVKVRTFSIGFHEESHNEAPYAAAVAKHLGTDHTEFYVSSTEALAVVPRIPEIYDEPFADSSQIPTYLVSQLARQHVTVSLSGDAGDELFGGYDRYAFVRRIAERLAPIPSSLRRLGGNLISGIPPRAWNMAIQAMRLNRLQRRVHVSGDRAHKLAEILRYSRPEDIYYRAISLWDSHDNPALGAVGHKTSANAKNVWTHIPDLTHRMMALDMSMYLPDDILVKVDRAAMAVSLETRVPLLDHRVVEFVWRLPLGFKVREGVAKWILRQVLYRYVPPALIERPKMGFGVPIGPWLRGPLRPWADELLREDRLLQDGFFSAELIRQRWREHLSGDRNWQNQLWPVLMFQAWLK